MESFKVGEQQMLEVHLKCIGKGDLLIGDANYGIFRVMKAIKSTGAEFGIRMSRSTKFVKDFLASGKKDAVLEWHPSRETIKNCKDHGIDFTPMKVRLVRIELSENEIQVVAFSLTDQTKYSYTCLHDLYDRRWAVEEEYKKFMQRLVVEFFSSVKENGILQDFYANVFMLNLVSFLTEPVRDEIYEASKDCKYRRQINWTSALGDVRKTIVLLFLRGIHKIEAILESLWESFSKNTEAIKPGRKFPRDKRKKGSRKKTFIQYKPAW
jgi:hypothetical protein